MLSLDNRNTFIDLLKPESGWTVEYMFGTSLAVDIRWLFSFLIAISEKIDAKENLNDPGRVLSAIRSYRGKLDLFVQLGKIDNAGYDLLLEEGRHFIRQVRVDKLGMFHPKVWVVQYTNRSGDIGDETIFKVIVSSRNAVFGTTLEGYILFEGIYDEKQKNQNRNLIQFVKDCYFSAGLALGENESMKRFIELLSKTRLKHSDDQSDDYFHYHGFGKTPALKELFKGGDYEHILVFSPFLTVGAIDYLRKKCTNFTLVSTLDNLRESLKKHHFDNDSGRCDQYYYVKPFIEKDTEDETSIDMSQLTGEGYGAGLDKVLDTSDSPSAFNPGFMHAKMYFLQKKLHPLELIIGSANCTSGLDGTTVEAVARVFLKNKKIDAIINSFIYGIDKNNESYLLPYILKFEDPEELLNKLSDEEQRKRDADRVFQNIMNLEWKAVYENSELVLACSEVYNKDGKIRAFNIENCKLKSDNLPSLFSDTGDFQHFVLSLSEDAVPGLIFQFTLAYEGVYSDLFSFAFIPIAGSPDHWCGKYEKQILARLDSIAAWYLFIFGLLYRGNSYEKAKSRRNVKSSREARAAFHSTENRRFSLERLLGIGEIDTEMVREIDEALKVFESKVDTITDKREYEGLLEEIMAFKKLFEIYSESVL